MRVHRYGANEREALQEVAHESLIVPSELLQEGAEERRVCFCGGCGSKDLTHVRRHINEELVRVG